MIKEICKRDKKKKEKIIDRLIKDTDRKLYSKEKLFYMYGIEYAKNIMGKKEKINTVSVPIKVNKLLKDTVFKNSNEKLKKNMIQGILDSKTVIIKDDVFIIKPIHWILPTILFLGSILLLFKSLNPVLAFIGISISLIGAAIEVLDIRVIRINTTLGRIIRLSNNILIVIIGYTDLFESLLENLNILK